MALLRREFGASRVSTRRYSYRSARLRAAFTLVELTVVLALMVLAAAAVVPGFVQFHHRMQLRDAARRTIALAGEARGLAVSGERTVALQYDPGAHGLRLVLEPSDADQEPPAGPTEAVPLGEVSTPDTRLLEYPLGVEVQIENPAALGEPVVRFYPDGRADGARILLAREGMDPILLAVKPVNGRMSVAEGAP